MIYKQYKIKAGILHTIKTDKFKSCHMRIVFKTNVIKSDITKRKVLFDFLTDVNKEYKTPRQLRLKQEELYNTIVYSMNRKVGGSFLSYINTDFINPKYTEKEMLEASISLPFEMIFNPLAENNVFDKIYLETVKNKEAYNIKSLIERPSSYATSKALQTLGEDSKSSFTSLGDLKDLEKITPQSLYEYYEYILNNENVDIYIIGDLDMDEAAKIINKVSKFKTHKIKQLNMYVDNKKRTPLIKKEEYVYTQTNVVIILNLNDLTTYEKNYVANLYDTILGGGSLETKLYKSLREENSLCYSVDSTYNKYDGLIVITTAIDNANEEKAIKLIKKVIKTMSNNITDEEFNQAKEILINSIKMSRDYIGALVEDQLFQNISDLDDHETRIKMYEKIKKEDIYNMSKKISLNTVYSLIGGVNNEDH